MDILSDIDSSVSTDDDMARGTKSAKVALSSSAQAFLGRLKAASSDKPSFDAIVAELNGSDLSAADVIGIAEKFAIPSKRPTSRKNAIAAITKRFVELARFAEKNRKAAGTRPW